MYLRPNRKEVHVIRCCPPLWVCPRGVVVCVRVGVCVLPLPPREIKVVVVPERIWC